MKANNKFLSLLALSCLLALAACAEPDETSAPQSKITSQGDSTAVVATEELLNEKYDKLELSCNLDISDKTKLNGVETPETKSIVAKFDLLKNLGRNPALIMKLEMSDLQSLWQLSIKSVTLSHVSYSSSTISFEADRSPTIDAILSGNLNKPIQQAAADQKAIQINISNSQNQIYENTTIDFVNSTEGPSASPFFSLKLACHLEATPKPQFAGEFRRK